MAGEIIRIGDPTTHGGKVIEGSPVDICHGKAIAYLGHRTYCPQCKGNFPIIEGAATTTFYGKGVALAGMKTACGAVLVATQFTDTVEYGDHRACSPIEDRRKSPQPTRGPSRDVNTLSDLAPIVDTGRPRDGYDLHFWITDKAGAPMIDWPYRIELFDGTVVDGRTDSNGKTQKVTGKTAEEARLHVYEPDVAPIDPHWDR